MPRATSSDDPPPHPPERPDLDDCCHSGCTHCVFDLYDEALERYEIALAAWQKRQADMQTVKPKPRAEAAPRPTSPGGKPRQRR